MRLGAVVIAAASAAGGLAFGVAIGKGIERSAHLLLPPCEPCEVVFPSSCEREHVEPPQPMTDEQAARELERLNANWEAFLKPAPGS